MKVAIIGCGVMARHHLKHVVKRFDPRFISVMDSNTGAAEQLAARFGITRIYDRVERLFEEQNPAAAHILTPPSAHAALARAALDAGCHVLIEKPMTTEPGDAAALIEVAARNRLLLSVNHNMALDPLVVRAERLLLNGRLGRLLHVEIFHSDTRRTADFSQKKDARTSWLLSMGGGPLFDMLPHPLSVLVRFLPEARAAAITKTTGALPGGLPDELRVLIDGRWATASVSVSMSAQPDGFYMRLYGTAGTLDVGVSNMTFVLRQRRNVPRPAARMIDAFEQALRGGCSAAVSALALAAGRRSAPADVGSVISRFYDAIESGSMDFSNAAEGEAVVELLDQVLRLTSAAADVSTGSRIPLSA